MNQRSEPRMEFKSAVDIHCPARNIHYKSITQDIGTGGLRLSGPNCMCAANDLSVVLPLRGREVQMPCRVVWADKSMIGVEFVDLTPAQRIVLQNLVEPCWDGDDLLDGLILMSRYLAAESLGDWLRITSLLDKHFRKSCQLSRTARGVPTISSPLH